MTSELTRVRLRRDVLSIRRVCETNCSFYTIWSSAVACNMCEHSSVCGRFVVCECFRKHTRIWALASEKCVSKASVHRVTVPQDLGIARPLEESR